MATKIEKARAAGRRAVAFAEGSAVGNGGGAFLGGVGAGVLDGYDILNLEVVPGYDLPLGGLVGGAAILAMPKLRRSAFWRSTAAGMIGGSAAPIGVFLAAQLKAM